MMNTPRVCIQETKKAFRKLYKEDITGAVQALCNLKGVGPAMASGEIYIFKKWPVRCSLRFRKRVAWQEID